MASKNTMNTKFFILFIFVAVCVFLVWIPVEFSRKMRKYNLNFNYLKSGLNYRAGLSGLENSNTTGTIDDVENEINCAAGLFLSEDDLETYDCSTQCKSKDYEFKYIDPKLNLVLGSKRFAGSYCMPLDCARCNLSTGRLLNFGSGFTCISKYPTLFGGTGATRIIGCNGLLTDRKTNTNFEMFITSDKIINADEKLADGTFRYVCTDQKDLMENTLITLPPSLGDRFELIKNFCLSMIKGGHPDFYPEFELAYCNCTTSDGLSMERYEGKVNNPCTTCLDGFGKCKGYINVHREYEDNIFCSAQKVITADEEYFEFRNPDQPQIQNVFSGDFFNDAKKCQRFVSNTATFNKELEYPVSPIRGYLLENPIEKIEKGKQTSDATIKTTK